MGNEKQSAQEQPRKIPVHLEYLTQMDVTFRDKNGILKRRTGLPSDMIALIMDEEERNKRC